MDDYLNLSGRDPVQLALGEPALAVGLERSLPTPTSAWFCDYGW